MKKIFSIILIALMGIVFLVSCRSGDLKEREAMKNELLFDVDDQYVKVKVKEIDEANKNAKIEISIPDIHSLDAEDIDIFDGKNLKKVIEKSENVTFIIEAEIDKNGDSWEIENKNILFDKIDEELSKFLFEDIENFDFDSIIYPDELYDDLEVGDEND